MVREKRLGLTRGLLSSPPCNHPGGITNTLRFGDGYETGDYEREMTTVTLCHCGPPGTGVHNLSWNREECPFLTTLYTVRIHTRQILDRHDYTFCRAYWIYTSTSNGHCVLLFVCQEIPTENPIIIMVFLSIQNVVVRI